MAEIGEGASLWASGSQECRGASPALVPYPTMIKIKASLITEGSSLEPISIRTVQLMASPDSPKTLTDE